MVLLIVPPTLLVGLILMIMPLPDWAQTFRPDWVALILIYWTMALPHRVGMFTALFSGIFLDVALGTLMGQHALGLVIITYINLTQHQRVRVYPLIKQALYVFILLLINQGVVVWIEGMMGRDPGLLNLLGPAMLGMLLWPWVFVVLRDLRRKTLKSIKS